MATFCNKCGTKLDEKTGLCPNCGVRTSPPTASTKKGNFFHAAWKACFIVLLFSAAFLIFKRTAPLRNGIKEKNKVGDTIEFGLYEQDNNVLNGKEPIKWIVLEKEDDHALLISVHCIEYKPYNNGNGEVTWEKSSLRKWLNNDFMDAAFSSTEKGKIITHTIENPGLCVGVDKDGSWIITNSSEYMESILYQTENSNTTEDKVCLLTADEAMQYLDSGIIGYSSMTEYTRNRFIESTLETARENGYDDERAIRGRYAGTEEKFGDGCCNWWLRSPGISGDCASVISYEADGLQSQNVAEAAAIRPVICVKIN